ncbi:E3 ubiquitin-protein ligase [Canna indica]|uniref:E3 ubiquitin-protein ligase n=1 Tax=Canna indica TaxID=4628 RepID=A0AAQ3Q5X7_9LILI|nr:E3 ubiquitin-protein ligase [Canna indica]
MTICRLLFVAAQAAAATAALAAALMLVGLGVVVALHAFVVGKALIQLRSGSARRGPPPEEPLELLPCYEFDFGAAPGRWSDEECAVCLERFGAGDRCRLLPACEHSFHAKCVDPWLRLAPVCPICRTRAASTTTTEAASFSYQRYL